MEPRTRRSLEAMRLKHVGHIFGRVVRMRAYFGAFLMATIAGTTLMDTAPWRRVWLLVQMVVSLSFFFYELRRYEREGISTRGLFINFAGGLALEQSLTWGTGGLASPLLPLIAPLAFVAAALLPGAQRKVLMAAELGMVAVLSVVHLNGWTPPLHLSFLGAPPRELLIAISVCTFLSIFAANAMGSAFRRTVEDMLAESFQQRDELLATHRTYARTLEALSGEIAHELKNPLATVKGLTQLMQRETGRAQPQERLEVLAGEVTRMQGILEEFLNFSRPLVPLSLSEVDLSALCDQALVLHEGVAAEHGVTILRDSEGPLHAVCDTRKVRQVVMNLLLNAIDASPRGGQVLVSLESASTGDVRVVIRDSGAGLSPELASRVFEAGVTTKKRGSGLGLTVARALARQHGGDVTLRNEVAGGCVAELVLPREPPADTLGPVRGREVSHAG
ncbi:sensor histidine kinase [Myxococcus stipitatus DSM 14675]|uniref:histidine kinase n=1 Tax=Myxococcus stipitatus (strain DSM 14675 / JCM 12634 / Mx s8) TaxID=1278073 RepID=L7UBH8_MYXSD|nr:HAMP domain-containing sensor histidine kinase [Myxococcus stipitatus]AGC45403.1 sensor histidine kinase [Myxococcus stipitatus DSM 14675]